MTRERYIVRNCPSAKYRMGMPWKILCEKESNCVKSIYCADCTDCVIKQVIEKCTNTISTTFSNECFELAKEVTDLFDIEEIKE